MDEHAYQEMADLQNVHWWFLGRRKILRYLLKNQAPIQPSRIIEIGCGVGGNLEMLAEFAPVIGIEASPAAIALSPSSASAQVLEGRLPGPLPVEPNCCDWVCLFDVLEHIDDDTGALLACRTLLRPGGAVIISVPAYRWLWSDHDVVLHHRRRYTLHELKKVASSAGLKTVYATYFNTWLFPLAALARLADRLFRPGQATGAKLPQPWVNRVLERVFASEVLLLKRLPFPFGLSLFVVLQAD